MVDVVRNQDRPARRWSSANKSPTTVVAASSSVDPVPEEGEFVLMDPGGESGEEAAELGQAGPIRQQDRLLLTLSK